LIAHGTSYFLKNKFGRGYYLTLAKKKSIETNMSIDQEASQHDQTMEKEEQESGGGGGGGGGDVSNLKFKDKQMYLTSEKMENFVEAQLKKEQEALRTLVSEQDKSIHLFIKREIDNAILVENIGTEMTYSISNKLDYTKDYERFFSKLENNMNNLGMLKGCFLT
jgi:hypothetical protein